MIQAKNINKAYDDLQVLKDINLKIAEQEIVSIVGPSGAGKSTLLHILGTLDRADSGNILFDNREIEKLTETKMAEFRNKSIGFVFQFHHLLPEFSAIENICLPAFISGINQKKAFSRAEKLLKMMGLENRKTHKPNQLSGGEQQRVAVARALINDPKVVLADEPSGNLDSDNSEELHNMFFNLRKELGHSFVIVTHNNTLADMADRKLQMKDGILLS
ncbi:MAG: ABC transporter ATP-binding protein [Bacteroidales bacterium]